MIMIIKHPGKVAEEVNMTKDEALEVISGRHCFVMYSNPYNVGMYISDGGYYAGLKQNFVWESHIIYGSVVFIGMDDRGRECDLTKLQKELVNHFLNRDSLVPVG